MSKTVLVLGGTGLLGFATIRELVARGYNVRSVALPPMPTADLFDEFGDKVTSHLADVSQMSDGQIIAGLHDCYAVIYAIGADERVTPPAPATRFFYEANVLPTQRIAGLARAAGVKKFVVFGSYFAEFAERLPESGLMQQAYPYTRILQEHVAFCEGEGAMDVTSLRLPYIFGTMPGRMPLWKMFSDQIKTQPVFPAHPDGYTAAVTTKQVAQAAVGAMENGKHRSTYAISGYNLKHADFYQMIADAFGLETQIPLVPFEAMQEQMRAIDEQTAASGHEHGIHMELAQQLRSWDLSIDPAETQSELGFEDDDIPASIQETLQYIIDHE